MVGWLRLDVVRLLILALPAFAAKHLLVDLEIVIGGRSWSAAGLLLPLLFAAWVVWQLRQRGRPKALGKGNLAFFLIYCLAFAIAADSDVFRGPRRLLTGYEDAVPRNFLALDRAGDWHYWWVPKAPPAHDLMVVTFPSFAGELREDVRRQLAFLVRKAVENEARGVAFDVFLNQPSEADRLLALVLRQADEAGMPVLFGYQHSERDGLIVREKIAPGLAASVPLERQGHLAGYLEYDDRVRMLPVDLPGGGGLPSLSMRVAEALAGGEVRAPAGRLLQFTEPLGGVTVEAFSPELDFERWRDRFVVVGTASENDRQETPFGALQGVVIHAWAANSLRHGHFIHRLDPRWTFPLIFLLCYLLTVMNAQGYPRRGLLLTAVALSLAVVGAAALVLRYSLVWVDASYPLLAIWGLMGIQLLSRTLRAEGRAEGHAEVPPAAGEGAEAPADGFDVFLSHNSRDKPQVRRVGELLKSRGLRPWLDEWELIPGRPWQEALEEIIVTVRSSAVLVGRDGLGPWEIPEMRASLSECVRRGLPVIPVLLPGAPSRPVLPLFLTQYTWVDLRGGLTEAGLDRLHWGVTGVKPKKRQNQGA